MNETKIPDGLDDCIKAIDAAVQYFGIEWEWLEESEKRKWMEDYARKHAHPVINGEVLP